MCISYLRQKVTTWVSKEHGDHLGQTQVITSYYLGQSYYLGRNSTFYFKSDDGEAWKKYAMGRNVLKFHKFFYDVFFNSILLRHSRHLMCRDIKKEEILHCFLFLDGLG